MPYVPVGLKEIKKIKNRNNIIGVVAIFNAILHFYNLEVKKTEAGYTLFCSHNERRYDIEVWHTIK